MLLGILTIMCTVTLTSQSPAIAMSGVVRTDGESMINAATPAQQARQIRDLLAKWEQRPSGATPLWAMDMEGDDPVQAPRFSRDANGTPAPEYGTVFPSELRAVLRRLSWSGRIFSHEHSYIRASIARIPRHMYVVPEPLSQHSNKEVTK